MDGQNPSRRSKLPIAIAVIVVAALCLYYLVPRSERIRMAVIVTPSDGEPFDADDPVERRRIKPGGKFRILLEPDRSAYALIYRIRPDTYPCELWPHPNEGTWPELPQGRQTPTPNEREWFELDEDEDRGESTLLIAWSDEPLRKRSSLWWNICDICQAGGKSREAKIEEVRRQLASIADGVQVITFRHE